MGVKSGAAIVGATPKRAREPELERVGREGSRVEPQGQQSHSDGSGRIPMSFDSMPRTATFRLFLHILVLWFTIPILQMWTLRPK